MTQCGMLLKWVRSSGCLLGFFFFESRSSLKFCRKPVHSGSILLQILRLVFHTGAAIIFCRVSERLYVADFSLRRPLVGDAWARSGNGCQWTCRTVSWVRNAYQMDPEEGQCRQVLGSSRAETSLYCQLGLAAVAAPSDPVSLQA